MTDRIGVQKSSPSTAFYLEADVVGTSGNSSRVRCYLRCVNAGNGSSQFNDSGFQAGSIDGFGEFGRHSGHPFLPGGYANGQWRWRDGYWDVLIPHNSDGTRGPVTLRMTLVYGNINESHTASLSFARIPKAPAAPTINSASPDQITANSMRVRFSGNDNGGSTVLEWQIQYDTSSSFNASPKTVSSNGTTTLTGLQPGTTYYYRARGRNAVGWGAYSSVDSGKTLTAPASPPTSVLLLVQPPTGLDVDWEPPTNLGGGAITAYDIQWSEDQTFTTGVLQAQTAGTVTEYEIGGLQPARTYWVRVRANNANAVGAWSTPLSAMIPAGGKAWTGADWKSAVLRAWTGSLWKIALLKYWDGTDWKIVE